MKLILCLFLLPFTCAAQLFQVDSKPFHLTQVSLPINYFPFYHGVQIIEVDYYAQSLEQGALNDLMYPRGGSSYHDAMLYDRPNGYLVRNHKGEIIANYGVPNLQNLKLSSPDSCVIKTHLDHLNSTRHPGLHDNQNVRKNQNGYGYRISRIFATERQTDLPERVTSLYGIMDTLGNIVIPMDHESIDYAHEEYLVQRATQLFSNLDIQPNRNGSSQKMDKTQHKPYGIYDSAFQLTMPGSDVYLKRISKNRYAALSQGCVTFMDRFGNLLHENNYYSIYDTNVSDLLIYNEYKNGESLHGLISRQLEEVTPPIFTSISPIQNGFMVRDQEKRNGYLNKQGKQLVPFELEAVSIDYRRDGFILFTQYLDVPNGKMLHSGLIDSTGNVVLPAEYWIILNFQGEIASVKTSNKWGLVNRSGEALCPLIYDAIGAYHRNFIEVTKNGKHGLLDRSGKIILEPDFTYVLWIDSIIHCGNDQSENFIYDLRSGERYKHSFGKLFPQKNGLSFYKKNDKFGLVNTHGKLMIPAQFDKVYEFRNNRALVVLNDQFGLLNEHGKIVQAIKYESYSYDNDGNYILK